jgi:hypothetical protein
MLRHGQKAPEVVRKQRCGQLVLQVCELLELKTFRRFLSAVVAPKSAVAFRRIARWQDIQDQVVDYAGEKALSYFLRESVATRTNALSISAEPIPREAISKVCE